MECDSCNSPHGYKEIDGLVLCYECFESAYPEKIKKIEYEVNETEWIELKKE